uniref:Uncharacterized protein n=1 Tax=Acrobeloides nanus TaxID=290746 RepID=A0A914EH70_9BILA
MPKSKKDLRAGIIRLAERGKSVAQGRRNSELDPRQRAGVHRSRYQPTTRQRRVATKFARSERHGLQHMEHPGGRGMLKAPPVNRRIEKEFDEGLKQHISRCYQPCGG